MVRPFEKKLNLTIIGPTIILKIQGVDHDNKIFGPTKVGVVGPAPPALLGAPEARLKLIEIQQTWSFSEPNVKQRKVSVRGTR